MPAITRADLRVGDILMTKHEGGLTHKVISVGSFFAGNFGTAGYVHAQGAAASLFSKTNVDTGVVNQLRDIEAGTSRVRLFCSQFVVVCYQVAVLRLARNGLAPQGKLLPFELDAKAMEPSYMVSYLRRNPQHWHEVGDFPGGHG